MGNNNLISVFTEEDRQKLLNYGFQEIKNFDGVYTFLNDAHKKNFDIENVHAISHNTLSI